jgi:hypothetical protein
MLKDGGSESNPEREQMQSGLFHSISVIGPKNEKGDLEP